MTGPMGPGPEPEEKKADVLHYPIDTTAFKEKANGFVKITIKERVLATAGEGFLKHIFLPQPSNFSFSDSASYNEFEQGQMAKAIKIGGQALLNFATGNNEATLATLGAGRLNTNDAAGSVDAFSADLVAATLAAAGNFASVQELGFERGVAIDKGMRTRFDANPIRGFQLQIELAPTSKKENKAIQNIINTLTLNTYASQGSNVFGLNYPPEMLVEFYHAGKPNLNMPVLQPCFLESVQSNYNPNGYGLHNDGAPEQYNLNLSFKEIKRLTQEDLKSLRSKQATQERDNELYVTQLGELIEDAQANREAAQSTDKSTEELEQEFLDGQGIKS